MNLVTKKSLPAIMITAMIIAFIPIFVVAGNCSNRCADVPKVQVQQPEQEDVVIGKFHELILLYL
ncbi:hypothetical protein [Pinibacter aurantiacus]|uniref:Uncharacterized protein n=1 Tax=Pinibacter aurantiacus TaxID=2851599 RepID=A0A9E2SBJ6_9BACT|nr:hypothetical protein [Pinibacter aurantiacus]MBV4359501.1 hypothetical protein [Pinibacter aurantiacus]